MKSMLAKTAVVGGIGLAAVGIGAGVASAHPVNDHGDGQQQWNGDGDHRSGDQGQDGAQQQWQQFWDRLPQVGQPQTAPQLPLPQLPRTSSLDFGSVTGSL